MSDENKVTAEEPKCSLCGKPLYGETWTDSDDYGDVHEQCLREKEGS